MDGRVDHVWLENGEIQYHVIGEEKPKDLCDSGLLNLAAVLLDTEILNHSGYLVDKKYTDVAVFPAAAQKKVVSCRIRPPWTA